MVLIKLLKGNAHNPLTIHDVERPKLFSEQIYPLIYLNGGKIYVHFSDMDRAHAKFYVSKKNYGGRKNWGCQIAQLRQ